MPMSLTFASKGRKVRRLAGLALAATVSVATLTACGSESAKESGGEADVAAAKKVVAQYQAPLTSFNLEPVKATPPRGKKVAIVVNNTPNTNSILVGAQEAAEALGWTTVPIVFDPSKPTGVQDAFAQAVDENPDGVVTAGQDLSTYAQAAEQFATMDIPVVASATSDEVQAPLIANVTNAEQTALAGRITANYVIAQKGADANVAMFNIPSFSILTVFEDAFKGEYRKLCPKCPYKSVPVQVGDIGTKVPAQVTSAIQTDPKINFAVMGFGSISIGVSAALHSAGLDDVKIVGEAPDINNIGNLTNGSEDMWVGYPLFGMGWKSIDALARHFGGESAEADTIAATPFQILTKANAPDPAALPEVADYENYFKKLWLVD